MDNILYKDKLIAIHVKASGVENGSHPATKDTEALQVVTLKHPAGAFIKAHYHAPRQRITEQLQEGLIVIKGKIVVDLYGVNETISFRSVEVGAGEAIILASGGHGIRFTEDSEVFEFKPGPFKDDKILI